MQSARRWTALIDLASSRLRRRGYVSACFAAPVWAAFAVEAARPSHVVLFGGFALVCLLIGALGLIGLLDRGARLPLRGDDSPALQEWKEAKQRAERRAELRP